MATKKITLNELRSIVKQIIKETYDEYGSKVPSKLTEWQDVLDISKFGDNQPIVNIPGHGGVKYKKENEKIHLIVFSSSLFKNSKNDFDDTEDSRDRNFRKRFLNDVAHQTARDISKRLSGMGIKNEIQSVDNKYTPGVDNLEVVFDSKYLSNIYKNKNF